MVRLLGSLLPTLRPVLRTRADLALENLALRQQLAALRQQLKRPRVRFADRLFWAWLHRFWGRWREALILVQPERECLDHVIVLGEKHLRRILGEYSRYYHRSRTHLSLEKDCPKPRAVQPPGMGEVVEFSEVGGLHHRYEGRAA